MRRSLQEGKCWPRILSKARWRGMEWQRRQKYSSRSHGPVLAKKTFLSHMVQYPRLTFPLASSHAPTRALLTAFLRSIHPPKRLIKVNSTHRFEEINGSRASLRI